MQCGTSLSLLGCHANRPYTVAAALASTFCFRNEFSTTTVRLDGVKPSGQQPGRTVKTRERPFRPSQQAIRDEDHQIYALYGERLASQLIGFRSADASLDQWRSRMRLIAKIKNFYRTPVIQRMMLQKVPIPGFVQDLIEYTPEVCHLLPEMNSKPTSPVPWRLNLVGTMNGRQVLGEEILRFSHFMQLSRAEKAARDGVFEYLRSVFERCTCDYGRGKVGKIAVETHGSVRSGLALTASDIDFRIYGDVSDEDPEAFRALAENLHASVFSPNITHDEELLASRYRPSRWPIISCQHRSSGLDIQMVATRRSTKQQVATAQYLKEFPLLVPLYVVLRQTLNHRGLLDVFYGGLGSYPLLMMIVAVLTREPTGRQEVTPESLAKHLLHFLHFYSTLDTRKTGLTADPPLEFGKHAAAPPKHKNAKSKPSKYTAAPHHSAPDEQQPATDTQAEATLSSCREMARANPFIPYLLTLQDPADPTNDLGCRSYAIKHITVTFRHLHQTLLAGIRRVDVRIGLGQSDGLESILLPLVGYCHDAYAERRSKAEEFGRYVLARHAQGKAIRSSGPRGPMQRKLESVVDPGTPRVPSPFS